jgi:hypothetical protein
MRYQNYLDATRIYGEAFFKLAEMPKAPETNENEGISGRVFADHDPRAQERVRAEAEHAVSIARMARDESEHHASFKDRPGQRWPKEASILSVYGTALASK